MGKSIACLGDTLLMVRKDQVVVLAVGKGREAGASQGIIIPITEDLAHDHHKDSVKAGGSIWLSAWWSITFPRPLI